MTIEPQSAGFSAADVFVSNKTPTGFDLTALAIVPVRLTISLNP